MPKANSFLPTVWRTAMFCLGLALALASGLSSPLAAQSNLVSAQLKPKPDPAARQIRAEMEFLAGDALQGRGSGTRDELLAAVYLVSELRQIRIAPAGDNGGYMQEVATQRPHGFKLRVA